MTTRSTILGVVAATVVALTACGSEGETSTTADVAVTAEGDAGTTVAAPTEATVAEPTADEDSDAPATSDEGCEQALTADEIESILGAPVEITGTGQSCNWIFASDAVGGIQVFSGSRADEAMDTLLPKYEADAGTRGALLDDGRGYVLDGSAVVRGDSGRVFSLAIPDSLDLADQNAALVMLTDLLLTR